MKFCPHCGENISAYLTAEKQGSPGAPSFASPAPTPIPPKPAVAYDQTSVWRRLVELARGRAGAAPSIPELVDSAVTALLGHANPMLNVNGLKTTVHLVFDAPITPRGGVMHMAASSNGRIAPASTAHMADHGYLMIDGKVVQVDGVPVGVGYGALDYWGGDKQFKRWHLAGPIEISPHRNDAPYFMDGEMVAFGVTWRDMSKIKEAMMSLLSTFATGVKGDKAIAQPMALEIIQTP